MSDQPIPARSFSLDEARHLWLVGQGLRGAKQPAPLPGGWSRALGGVDPYLSLFARDPSTRRAEVDAALHDEALWIVPGARGCIWLVPRGEVTLALRVGDAEHRKRNQREMERLGVSESELAALALAVIEVLEGGPLNPEDLRERLPHGSWRALGEDGKKLGHSTTLPTALRTLEADGLIRRFQDGGRLDTQRYLWGKPSVNPLTLGAGPTDGRRQSAALAALFFAWAGPATLDEFMAWSSATKRLAAEAVKGLDVLPVKVEGQREVCYVSQALLDAATEAGDDDRFHFLPAQDNLLTHRGSPGVLADPRHHGVKLLGMSGRGTVELKSARWINQRLLVHRGKWVGMWSWDLTHKQVIFAGFDPFDKATRARIQPQADAVTAFIRDELEGSVRANGIDSEAAQEARMHYVQEMPGAAT